MRSSLFIKTYAPDLKWLRWCIKFLEKNWSEESQFVVMAPNACTEEILSMSKIFKTVPVPREEWGDGYIGQQFSKLTADLYCQGDYITFIDSDSMLVSPTSLNNLCVEGKPVVWTTPYSVLGNTVPWQRVVSGIMMIEPQLEYMRCHPFTYHKDTIKRCRERLEDIHGVNLETMMKNRPMHSFSEFNVLGFFANVFDKNRYVFKDTGNPEDIADWSRVKQFFSYGDWTPDTPRYLTDLLSSLDNKPLGK